MGKSACDGDRYRRDSIKVEAENLIDKVSGSDELDSRGRYRGE